MKMPELPFDVQSGFLRRLLLIGIVCWMATYPIYTSYYKANAVEQYERHLDFLEGKSLFFNPWQYRVLCPLAIEGTYQLMDATVYSLMDIKGLKLGLPGDVSDKNANTQKLISLLEDPVFIKYTVIFLGFRFIQHVLILCLAYALFSIFVKSKYLKWLGLILITLFMGNGVVDSDHTFNTYLDIIVYLWAGLVILKKLNPWWIVLITLIGVFNRETSILIPAIYFFVHAEWGKWPDFKATFFSKSNVTLITTVASIVFIVSFVGIRWYVGYEPQSSWRVDSGWPMLKLNLFSSVSVKTYFELFGVFAFLPIWAIFTYRTVDVRLRIFFWVVVPVWFAIHLAAAIAYQTRLFLVPVILVLMPMVLEYIEKKSEQYYIKR